MRSIRRNATVGRRVIAGDDGFSLPELIVAMSLLAILMTLVVTLFTVFTTNFTQERSATDSTNVAAIGMKEITKVIRAGTTIDRNSGANLPVFIRADKETLILHSYLAEDDLNPAPIIVKLSIDGNRQLIESRWNATRPGTEWIFPNVLATPMPAATTERSIARKVVTLTAAQVAGGERYLFTYLRVDGTEMTTPVLAADLGSIAAVTVTMLVQADETARAAPVMLRNRVGIPNLTASRLGLEG